MVFDSEAGENFLESVQSTEDFLAFIEWLAKDYWDDIDSWQNRDVDQYLRAIGSWIEDQTSADHSKPAVSDEQMNWSKVASLLYVGKIYE